MSTTDPKAALSAALAALMKSRGFRKDGLTWRQQHAEVIVLLNLQNSEWSPSLYINVGLFFHALDAADAPTERQCHVRQRLDALVPDPVQLPTLLDLQSSISSEERAANVAWLVQEFALPWLAQNSTLAGARQAFPQTVQSALVAAPVRGLLFPASDV